MPATGGGLDVLAALAVLDARGVLVAGGAPVGVSAGAVPLTSGALGVVATFRDRPGRASSAESATRVRASAASAIIPNTTRADVPGGRAATGRRARHRGQKPETGRVW
jgi:hypothetical protein